MENRSDFAEQDMQYTKATPSFGQHGLAYDLSDSSAIVAGGEPPGSTSSQARVSSGHVQSSGISDVDGVFATGYESQLASASIDNEHLFLSAQLQGYASAPTYTMQPDANAGLYNQQFTGQYGGYPSYSGAAGTVYPPGLDLQAPAPAQAQAQAQFQSSFQFQPQPPIQATAPVPYLYQAQVTPYLQAAIVQAQSLANLQAAQSQFLAQTGQLPPGLPYASITQGGVNGTFPQQTIITPQAAAAAAAAAFLDLVSYQAPTVIAPTPASMGQQDLSSSQPGMQQQQQHQQHQHPYYSAQGQQAGMPVGNGFAPASIAAHMGVGSVPNGFPQSSQGYFLGQTSSIPQQFTAHPAFTTTGSDVYGAGRIPTNMMDLASFSVASPQQPNGTVYDGHSVDAQYALSQAGASSASFASQYPHGPTGLGAAPPAPQRASSLGADPAQMMANISLDAHERNSKPQSWASIAGKPTTETKDMDSPTMGAVAQQSAQPTFSSPQSVGNVSHTPVSSRPASVPPPQGPVNAMASALSSTLEDGDSGSSQVERFTPTQSARSTSSTTLSEMSKSTIPTAVAFAQPSTPTASTATSTSTSTSSSAKPKGYFAAAAAAPPPVLAKKADPPPSVKSVPARKPATVNYMKLPERTLALLEHEDVNYNPDAFDVHPSKARFFVIKSYCEDDIYKSVKKNVWTSTEHGNRKLNKAFVESKQSGEPVYLFFSVNGSGHFCGIAQMASEVDFQKCSGIWAQDKWKGEFKVRWIFLKDVPNGLFKNVQLPNNEMKPVTNSRDTQEVPLPQGVETLAIIAAHKHKTCIFDDFEHYEQLEKKRQATKQAGAANGSAGKPSAKA